MRQVSRKLPLGMFLGAVQPAGALSYGIDFRNPFQALLREQ